MKLSGRGHRFSQGLRQPYPAQDGLPTEPRPCSLCGVVARTQSQVLNLSLSMIARSLNPILNVSDLQASFAWFSHLGWTKSFDWGAPPTFGAVCSGECSIFLCLNGQGSRGKGSNRRTFGPDGDESADKGVWMSIWVEDVEAVHAECRRHGLDVTWPPTDMPWNARELHVRHPDGHVFRISQGLPETAEES